MASGKWPLVSIRLEIWRFDPCRRHFHQRVLKPVLKDRIFFDWTVNIPPVFKYEKKEEKSR